MRWQISKKEEVYCIRTLCVFLYLFFVLNTAGVTTDVSGQEERGDDPKPKIAITFDDGPSIRYTEKLLNGLRERNVKATFFLIGKYVEKYPELAGEISRDGHLIGNHTYSHAALDGLNETEAKKELETASMVIEQATGSRPQYMRPPYGKCSRKLEDSLDMILVRWTVDPMDWNDDNADEIVRKVVTDIEENDIILLHDNYASSVEAALSIIDILKERGFEFVTVDALYVN